MTEAAPVLLNEDAGIAHITLNRPRAGNSLSMEMVEALRALFAV